jgi:hypothetical protein
MNSTRSTNVADVQADLDQLRLEVAAINAELSRRDVEQMEIEGAVEYLKSQSNTHHWVLGALIIRVLGRTDTKYGGKELHNALYPCTGPVGPNSAGYAMTWGRPRRRWSQFGTLREMLALAEANGVKLTSDERRSKQRLVRRLWLARLLPGSVDLLTEKIARETA